MKMTYNKTDVENPVVRAVVIAAINDAQHGGFMRVHGFQSKEGQGEIANYTYCKGIDYKTQVETSKVMLAAMQADDNFTVTVKRGVWKNDKGEISPTNVKSKAYPIADHVEKTYSKKDPALIAALTDLQIKLYAPAKPMKEYDKLGNGIYEDEKGDLFLRDLRVVRKDIVKKGDWKHTASGEIVAIVKALKSEMPISKYRQFRFDGDYEKITLGGIEMEQDNLPAIEVAQEKTAVEVAPVAEPVAAN